MSGKAKRTPKKTPTKQSADGVGDNVDNTPQEKSPTRRSLRIRGAKAELDVGALEEIEKRNRRSRSRSASISSQANPSLSTQSLSTQDTLQEDDECLASDISTMNDASELLNAGLNSTLRVNFDETASSGVLSTPGSGKKRRSSTLKRNDMTNLRSELNETEDKLMDVEIVPSNIFEDENEQGGGEEEEGVELLNLTQDGRTNSKFELKKAESNLVDVENASSNASVHDDDQKDEEEVDLSKLKQDDMTNLKSELKECNVGNASENEDEQGDEEEEQDEELALSNSKLDNAINLEGALKDAESKLVDVENASSNASGDDDEQDDKEYENKLKNVENASEDDDEQEDEEEENKLMNLENASEDEDEQEDEEAENKLMNVDNGSEDEDEQGDEEEEVDLFNLKEGDLENLERDLKEMENEHRQYEDEASDSGQEANEVDESGDETPDEDELSDDETMDDDAKRKKRNRIYEEDLEEESTVVEKRKRFKKSVVDDKFFSLAEMHEFMDAQDKLEEKRRLGKFDGAEKMMGLIEKFEAENLRPRTWELAGEVTAEERDKDELLDHFVDADFQAKSAPIITTETTEKLESIIIKRIKDKAFDDVERKARKNELISQYRAKTSFEDTIRKSLADVYEEEFKGKQSDEVVDEPKMDPAVHEIDNDMKKLFKKLDALSHYEFTPSQVRPEVKIVKNVASLRAEEVGPMASVEASSSLLAPEEVLKRVKAAPKAKEEMTVTDKKRLRRKKKVKQSVLAAKGLMTKKDENGEDGESSTKKPSTLKKKLKKRKIVSGENITASTENIPKKKKKKVKKAVV